LIGVELGKKSLILGLKFSYNFPFHCGKLAHVEKKIAFRPKTLATNLKEARK
jgi:hypothetical protein